MEIQDRRALIVSQSNPAPAHDYVSTLSLTVDAGTRCPFEHGGRLEIRLVPDRAVADPEAFRHYLETVADLGWETAEACAAAVLDDVNNELVPRWVQVSLVLTAGGGGSVAQTVVIEDRQPSWSNAELMARLEKV